MNKSRLGKLTVAFDPTEFLLKTVGEITVIIRSISLESLRTRR